MRKIKIILCILFYLSNGFVYANTSDPIVVNAIITTTEVKLIPDVIPANTPFVMHIINNSNVPVELENSDTSMEIYTGLDKTFKIGLNTGSYKFFNDFNPKAKVGILIVGIQTSHAAVVTDTSVNSIATSSVATGKMQVSEILFIMWRESIEALLVVGVVFSWIKHLKAEQKTAMVFLWLGVVLGLAFAATLGFILVKMNSILTGNAQNYLQSGVTFIAAIMMVYMVKWMRINGRTLKADMLGVIDKNAASKWNISILIVVAIAIAREGSEAMVFIYAIGFGQHGKVSWEAMSSLGIGVILAITTVYIFQLCKRIFSWKYFFKVTEILLLLLGGGLFINCVNLLVPSGRFALLHTKLWDSSSIISDGGHIAPMLTSLIGYRSTPTLIDITVYGIYWISIYFFFKQRNALPVRQN